MRVMVTERRDDWHMQWDDGREATTPTATDALRAVREAGRIAAEASGRSVIVIEWQPTTRIGRSVVKALQ